ncbi:hypothetical protein HDU81_004576 [Chytriomyces hyalinus]|nr:hypothetical protein HDU81_004576 [Chytriomyces hyalinus]
MSHPNDERMPAPPQAQSGRWLFVPSGVAVAPAADMDDAASIGYSDFFISELTSDSEDSETGQRLDLNQRRRRHEAKRAGRKAKWAAPAPTPQVATHEVKASTTQDTIKVPMPPAAASASAHFQSSDQSAPGFCLLPGSPESLLEAMAVLNARVSNLLTVHLSASEPIRSQQLEGVSAAINSATFVLDSIESNDNASIASGVTGMSIGTGRGAKEPETASSRANKLVSISDRLRLYAEKMRDQDALTTVKSDGAKYAEKQRNTRVDTIIRRVEREMKKGGL